MKKLIFIANWKSHKTPQEAQDWFESFARYMGRLPEDREVIVCPPYPLLDLCQKMAQRHTPFVKIGSQDISRFPEGAYTGDVSGKLITSYATHCIIGHSERRQNFGDTDEVLSQKVIQAQANMLTPVFCLFKKDALVPKDVKIVAYEPIESIGTGNAADPGAVEEIAGFIKSKNGVSYILYGGSVTPENASIYTSLPSIDGVLVGGASLDPQEFAQMIQHA